MREKGGLGDYGPVAGYYAGGRMQYPNWIYEELLNRARKFRMPIDTLPILDVGCGTGVGTRSLHDHGFERVIGMDIDSRMLRLAYTPEVGFRKARSHGYIPYLCSSIADLAFNDETFKIITSFGGLPWFGDDDTSMKNLRRILRVQGLLMAADEIHLFESQDLEDIKNTFARDRPRTMSVLDPLVALKNYGFSHIEHLQREALAQVPSAKAAHYLLSGSWFNYVPPSVQRDAASAVWSYVRSCAVRDTISWSFRFKVVFAKKPHSFASR